MLKAFHVNRLKHSSRGRSSRNTDDAPQPIKIEMRQMLNAVLANANTHYVDNVIKLSTSHKVVASNDIYDERGTKLISKGAQLDPSMRERLVSFKLRQPLESSLATEKGVDNAMLLREAESLLDEMPALAALLQATDAKNQALAALKELKLDDVSTTVLSMGESNGGEVLRHNIQAALTAVAFGSHMKLDHNTLVDLALVGLLHDIGELYINPEFRNPTRPLTPEEWKHTAAHPRIGQIVIKETTGYSSAISAAIDEHHERANGFGYPRRLNSTNLSQMGKILLASEVLCGIFTKKGCAMKRATLAFKVIPGEYPPEIVSLISSAYRNSPPPSELEDEKRAQLVERTRRIMHNIDAALAPTDEPPTSIKSVPAAATLTNQARNRLLMLQRAMHATGLSSCSRLEITDSDAGQIVLEMETVIYEIEWRLRELSRQIILDMLGMQHEQQKFLTTLALSMVAD